MQLNTLDFNISVCASGWPKRTPALRSPPSKALAACCMRALRRLLTSLKRLPSVQPMLLQFAALFISFVSIVRLATRVEFGRRTGARPHSTHAMSAVICRERRPLAH